MLKHSVQSLDGGHAHFGFDLDPQAQAHLQTAAARVGDTEAYLRALNAAHRQAPEKIEVLQALYRHHFYRGDLQQALDIVYQALIKASLQGGFSRDWTILGPHSADWHAQRGPARSFLYSLKALAFIRLRQNDSAEAARILATLERLDPQDQVGGGVIRDLLEGIQDDELG